MSSPLEGATMATQEEGNYGETSHGHHSLRKSIPLCLLTHKGQLKSQTVCDYLFNKYLKLTRIHLWCGRSFIQNVKRVLRFSVSVPVNRGRMLIDQIADQSRLSLFRLVLTSFHFLKGRKKQTFAGMWQFVRSQEALVRFAIKRE